MIFLAPLSDRKLDLSLGAKMRYSKLALIAVLGFTASASAQNSDSNTPISQIIVSGHGETRITPDRATIELSVQSRGATAAGAAHENARKQTAVMDALKRAGLSDTQISTTNYSVAPEYKYPEGSPPVVTGYVVTNTVVGEILVTSTVGSVIDAALTGGANVISALNFYPSDTEAAKRTAIGLAVRAARSDADAAAQAAGGSLGELLEITVNGFAPPPPRPMLFRSAGVATAQVETPISAGPQTVSVDVTARWSFLPSH